MPAVIADRRNDALYATGGWTAGVPDGPASGRGGGPGAGAPGRAGAAFGR